MRVRVGAAIAALTMAAAMGSTPAAAATFFGGTTQNGLSIAYELQVNDILAASGTRDGAISGQDVTAARFTFTGANYSRTFTYDVVNNGTPAGDNFFFYNGGASRTGNDILFNYGSGGVVGINSSVSADAYCIEGGSGFCAPATGSLLQVNGVGSFVPGNGAVVIASAPEPTSWALMILGFGVAGGAIRQARRPRARATKALA